MWLSKKKRIEVLETKVRSLESRMEFYWKVIQEMRSSASESKKLLNNIQEEQHAAELRGVIRSSM